MKVISSEEIDIKAYFVYIIAIVGALFGWIDWLIAVLFILSNIKFSLFLRKKEEKT